ncbi:hypothetical protein GIB67_001894 [Kingdonia uniflora]|uniref:Phosphofructokinase domain-containing protein n=1 Tax=Kingdonia uniflora TaxID=39325 RepID=A0A7J7LQG3_9MAGN|nr:hypothetical protein GIB67_001894 [Kingdonia uniflora]
MIFIRAEELQDVLLFEDALVLSKKEGSGLMYLFFEGKEEELSTFSELCKVHFSVKFIADSFMESLTPICESLPKKAKDEVGIVFGKSQALLKKEDAKRVLLQKEIVLSTNYLSNLYFVRQCIDDHFYRKAIHYASEVYIIGGDGTQKGSSVIFKEVEKRGLQVSVAKIPKTIDNDIAVIDKFFGFDTAVEEAQRAINAAHVEVESFENGAGIVKLMGRYSGFIAMCATLANRDVDCCLIPESPFYLEEPSGLFEFIELRLKENGHIVIVLAEGARQEHVAKRMDVVGVKDASGNKLHLDTCWPMDLIGN